MTEKRMEEEFPADEVSGDGRDKEEGREKYFRDSPPKNSREQAISFFAKGLADLLAGGIFAGLEKNIKALFRAAFERADLVTREEFDVQADMLLRTRIRLQELEERVAALEAALREHP